MGTTRFCEFENEYGEKCVLYARTGTNPPRCVRHKGKRSVLKDGTPQSYLDFISGVLTPAELTETELVACRPYDEDSSLNYRVSMSVPKKIQDAVKAEIFERADRMMFASMMDVVEGMIHIATSHTIMEENPGAALRAQQTIIERLRGRTPQTVNVSTERPFEVMFDRLTAERPSELEATGTEQSSRVVDFTDRRNAKENKDE